MPREIGAFCFPAGMPGYVGSDSAFQDRSFSDRIGLGSLQRPGLASFSGLLPKQHKSAMNLTAVLHVCRSASRPPQRHVEWIDIKGKLSGAWCYARVFAAYCLMTEDAAR